LGGPILPPGCPKGLTGGKLAARVGDMATCVGPPDTIIPPGCPKVLIGGQPAARNASATVPPSHTSTRRDSWRFGPPPSNPMPPPMKAESAGVETA